MSMQNKAPQGRPMGGHGPMGGGPMAMGVEKARDFKGTMVKLFQYLGVYKLAISFVLVLTVASTIASILGPKILGSATTKLFAGVMNQIAGMGTHNELMNSCDTYREIALSQLSKEELA